jgi:hypothetical protein
MRVAGMRDSFRAGSRHSGDVQAHLPGSALVGLRRYLRVTAAVLLAGGLLMGTASASAARSGCAQVTGHLSRPPVLSLDPRPGAPRIFAMQYRQEAANVVSYGSFRTALDCMLHRYVLPHLARGRPNVVVFDEDIGLATLGIGSRGATARKLFARRGAVGCAPQGPCGALGALPLLDTTYASGGQGQAFVGATDTIVRSFMGTFSALAKRYHLYMLGSADFAPFRQSHDRSDLARFSDPDLRPRPSSVYVATAPAIHNEAVIWGPSDVRAAGPDVLRNAVAINQKVPLNSLETFLGFAPGPADGPAARANLRPYRLPGTRARLGIATSLPAFVYGSPPAGVDPCSDTSAYYMRCLDRLGANIVIQDEANPGRWTGADGNQIEQWQPLSWMSSTYRTVSDPSVQFAYNVTAMMVGNLADLVFDGQSAITQRGGARGRGCAYIGNRRFVPGEDQTAFRRYAGLQRSFLAIAPWVVGDRSRAALRAVGAQLAPASGAAREDNYVQTALIADLPLPVDHRRAGCA